MDVNSAHTKFVDNYRETSRWPRRPRGIEEAKSADPLYTQITSSPPYPYLLTFLPFILSFICAFFLFALPSFASDKLLFKFVECTQTSGLNEVLVFERHSALFFFSALLDMSKGRKGLHGRSDKSHLLTKRQEEEERKRENLETIFDSDSPTVYTTKERYGLSDLVKGKAGVRAHQILCVWECSCACQKEIKRREDIFFSCLVACTW